MVFKKFKIDPAMMAVILDASVVGLHMVSHLLVSGGIGYLLDRWLDTKPILFMVFMVLGIAAGFVSVYRDVKRILRKLDVVGEPGREARKDSDEVRKVKPGDPPVDKQPGVGRDGEKDS